ncbi:benzoate/H(+) symporter BenE family transporter [Pseudomonas sp. F1_0610]|uniref:benzoate/H(+) symporter BenE family transporter n=1 Tax=Pseudomonas sp. F1_0610 TaxID=3114284 RepID=UPI0039C16E2C
MQLSAFFRHLTFSAVIAGFVAVLVGYTSSAAIVVQALTVAGLPASQMGGWLSMLGIAMGITSIGLSLYYRIPVLTAWSTPGAALLVTSLTGVSINEAIGVFIFASGLMLLCGITGIFERLITHIPQAIASAMLAGILLRFGLDAFVALQEDTYLFIIMFLSYLLAKRYIARYAIMLMLIIGLITCLLQGSLHEAVQGTTFAIPEFISPHFSLSSLLGVGLPFFIVTMASQNTPGIAILQAAGYKPKISSLITYIALATLLFTPWGGFSIGIAAITAAICMGKDVHPDPDKRYIGAVCAGFFYLLAGIFGGSIGMLFSILPSSLIHILAGLALLGTLANSLQRALIEESKRDAALVTFLVTASGASLFSIGSAFWGLIAGVITYMILQRARH